MTAVPPEIPRFIGKYRIDSVLGTGAMGVVFKGFDPQIEREVAIKTIRPDLMGTEEQTAWTERFAREVRAAARCIHPNVVTIFEFGEVEGFPFIVMEYCPARPLSDFLMSRKAFEVPSALFVVSQVLAALGAAHSAGIVHRDIKPGNVLLLDSGAVKVTDFGIARLESSTMTAHGAMVGTPSYMSPEQYMGRPVDLRSDLFSTAVLAYELLTGQRPFQGATQAELMYRLLNEEPAALYQANPAVPPGIEAAVLRCLAKVPDMRFQSAGEFAGALASGAGDAEAATIIAPAQQRVAPRPAAGFDEAVLAQAERRLARHVGPIAKVLVKRAAGRCGSVADLYAMLAEGIDDPAAAAAFRKSGGQGAADTAMQLSTSISRSSGQRVAIDADTLTETQLSLASHLGPVARVLVQKASARADSLEGFYRILADSIPEGPGRAAFLRKYLGQSR